MQKQCPFHNLEASGCFKQAAGAIIRITDIAPDRMLLHSWHSAEPHFLWAVMSPLNLTSTFYSIRVRAFVCGLSSVSG